MYTVCFVKPFFQHSGNRPRRVVPMDRRTKPGLGLRVALPEPNQLNPPSSSPRTTLVGNFLDCRIGSRGAAKAYVSDRASPQESVHLPAPTTSTCTQFCTSATLSKHLVADNHDGS